MKYSNTVEYNIKTSLDSKGLTQLKSELQGLELKLQNMGNKGLLEEKTFVNARNQIQGLGQALSDAFNPSLGMLDLSKLNQELKNNDVTAQGLKTAFSSLGAEGQVAFNNLVGELGKLDTGILRTNSQMDKLFTTFSNTFRWGLVSSFFSQFMNAIHSSVDYVKELDDSLTQIMLVTDYNRDSMNEFAKSANEAAKAVSMTTTGMTNASLIFAQQGYDLNQSQELATLSAKLANASQQDTATTSDQITAYMNAYGLEDSIEELTQQMDNWALIANVSAADVGELAQASQRAASMANAVGVSGEQLAAQIATIESVTREAPEQIGNGLKTLYARFSDISAGKEDEDGFGLGKVTSELNKIGVQVLNEMGQIRDVGDIMEDLMVIWDDLDQTSKVAAAQALAGKYQVNRFMALMDNSDMYQEYKGATGSAATGTLDQMNEEFANSIEGRSAKLQASLEGLFSTIFNTDDIYPWMDAAQGAVDLLQQFFDALGGGKTVLLGISSLLMQVFSKNMAQEINNATTNRAVQQQKLENLQNSQAALTTLGAANPNPNDTNSQNILNFAQYMQANAKNFNAEQMNQANSILQELVQNSNAATMAADKLKDSLSVIGTGITATTGESILAPFLDSEGAVNATLLSEALQNMSQSEVADMFSHIQEDIKPARESLLEFNKALQDYQQELRNADSTDDSWSQSLANLQAALDNLDGKIDPSTYERYEQAVKDIAEVTKNAGDKTAETTAEVGKLADGLEKVAAKDLTNLDQLNKDAFQAKNTQMAAKDSDKVAKAFEQGMDSQAQIQGILNTLNAVQQLTFAWQTFQNLGSIWSNNNLSEGEKLLQTIMALGTALPSVITAVQTLQTTMDGLIAKDKEWITQTLEAPQKAIDQAQSEREAMQAIYEKAEANLFAAQSELSNAEAEVNGIEIVLRAIDAQIAYTKSIYETAKAKAIANNDSIKLAQLEAQETASITKMQADRTKAEVALAGAKEKVTAAQIKVTEAQQRTQAASAALSAAFMGVNAAMSAYSGAMLIATGRTEGLSAALTFLEKHPVIIALTAIAMAATTIFGIIKAQAEEAKQEAQSAFDEAKSNLEKIQSIKESISGFSDQYNGYKESGEGGKELIQQANEIAQAMKEAGAEEEANAIHLAALRAEARGTADDFSVLASAIENSQDSMSENANNEAIVAAEKLLKTENVSAEDVLRHQSMLKEAQEELNSLDPLDAGYEAEKERLEHLIATLKDAKLAEEELVDAANTEMNSKLDIGAQKVAEAEGQNMHVFQAQDAGTEVLTPGAMNWSSIDQYFKEISPEYAAIADEAERAAIAYEHMGTEAGKAAVEVGQLLLANESLTNNGGMQTTYDANTGQALSQYELIGRQGIQTEMSDMGMDHEQQVQFLATLDENASESEIRTKLAELKQRMQDGQDFDVALKASLDPEQLDEMVKNQINSYEPTDEDVDADQFKSMANYIHDADASAFEEGGMLEDISPEIQNNADALEELVEGILRYDDAVSTLSEKEEEWRDALSDNADLADRTEAIGELKETYSDFLDLSDDVSDTFAENTHNLDLMAEAAAGDADSYNELLAAASEDIAVHVYGIDETSAALHDMSDFIQSDDFKNVEIGMAIDPTGEQGFYDALNRMIVEGNLTRDQVESYLNDIGCSLDPSGIEQGLNTVQQEAIATGNTVEENATYTTTVETGTAESTDTNEATSLEVKEVPGGNWSADVPTVTVQTAGMPAATSVPISGTVPPSFEVTAKPIKSVDTKQTSGSSVKTERGGAGDFHIKNGGVKKNNSGGAKNNHSGGGGGGGGGSCFVAGTFVSTWGGFKPIEQIKKGNIVLSYNEQTGLNEYSEVLQTMIHDTTELIYTLYIKDEQLRVTGIHRFLIVDKITCGVPQWVHAADLKVGDWVMFADGSWHVIHKIKKRLEHQIVYNFEVSDNHNYYVGRNQILAHNKGGKSCFVAGTKISTSFGFKNIETIKPRDIVLSYNEQTKQNEYSSVVQTMIHDTKESIYTLYIKNEKLRVTGIHRFFITHNIIDKTTQWIQAENLHVGDWVLCADGTWHVIWKIEVNIEQQTVYNFEVSNNHNYYVGRNQILAHNKGGKKGGGKKGGGGGKAKTIEPKEKKEHEKDYYEEVNKQLDKTEKVLSGIEKKQDKLTGDKARANQNKQINLLQKEIVLQKEKLKILKNQEKVDVAKKLKETDKEAEKLLKKNKVSSTIPNPIYDEDGMIANYEQMSKAIDNAHNKLIDKYNAAAAAGNEELTKQIQKDIDKFDKLGDTILKNAKRSNEIVTEIEEANNTIQEFDDSIEDIRIDAYKASQEAIDNLKELQEEIAETNSLFRDFDEDSFMNSFSIDDTPYGKLIESVDKLGNTYSVTKEKANDFYQDLINQKKKEAASTKDEDERKAILSSVNFFEERRRNLSDDGLQNGLLGISMEDLNRLQGWIDGTNKEPNPFGTNISALYEAYDDARKRTLELFKDYRETIQDMRDAIIDIYDEQEDAINRNIDNYNRLLDNLERIGDTYQLYYGEDNYEQILNLMQQQGNTMQSQLDQLTLAYQHWYEEYKKALEVGDETLIEEIEDKMNDAEEAMLDKAEELAEHWVEMFEKAVEANTQSIYDRLFNNKDIDELTSNWELQKDYMQRYKDDIEKTYELDKLRSKYIDLLNDAQGSSLQTQNKIRQQMQEQLKQLQDQATVSEYDVKLANAKLEILQKQIALEDAQRNKNQMQLRRDTQGNYRYVYRANQDDVKAAQDELLNSEYDAYELTKNETISNNDRALTLVQDFLAKRADIFNKYKDDDEARTKALEELSANYSQLLGTLEEDFRDTTNGMYDILTYMVQNATGDTSTSAMEMLNNLFDEEGKFKDNTQILWADLANVVTEMLGNFEDTVKDANEEMISQSEILKTKMTGTNGVLTKIGSSANEMETSLNNAANATNNLAIATSNLFESFSTDSVKFQEMLDKLSDYEEQLGKTQRTTSSLALQLKDAQATIKTQTAKAEAYHTDLTNLQSGKYTFDKEGNVVSKASLEAQKKQSEETKKSSGSSNWSPYSDAYQIWMNGKWGGGGYWYGPYIAAGHTKAQADQVLKLFNSGYGYKWMDTGGYTGTWNSNEGMSDAKNGKLAVLHQKELILNADDTKNILAAVSIIRELSSSMRESLNPNNFKGTMNVSSTYNPLTEQRVEIQATFPNATDADDIREALIGLSDQAYQYAHRNI